jgi:hypothetical protein
MPDFYDLPPVPDEAKPGSLDYQIIEWADSRLRRGIKFVESQVGYDKISKAIDEVFAYEGQSGATYFPSKASGLSQTRVNLIAKVGEDLTAMLTDTRYFWDYQTKNPKYQQHAKASNDRAARWYENRQIALRIGDVIRYYTVAGTGFAHLFYDKRINDMMVHAEDPRNVFPIDPLTYHSVQDAMGVIIRRARTPEWFREEFDKVVSPDVGDSIISRVFGWLTGQVDGPADRGGPLSKKSRGDNPILASPTVYVNTMYLTDKRVNRTDKTVRMGKWVDNRPATQWSYEVAPGAPLYPFKRMICWANGVLGYDGPSPYWHAKFPLIKLTLNPWPWSWFGKAPVTDCIPLNQSMNSNLRVIDDHSNQVAQPGIVADRNVSKEEWRKFDSRAPGYKIRTNMASGKGIQIQNPPPLDAVIWEIIKWCDDKIQKIAGTADPSAMASLAQIPSDDTIDTIMKAMTPGVRLRSRILEAFYTEFADQFLYCQWEWDTVTKRVAELGPSSLTREDFDYEPTTGIPDDVPDGEPGDIGSDANALGLDNPRPLYQRAYAMLQSFACKFDPSSLLNSAAQQELMKYFVLAKMGYLSVFTLMEKMGMMNFVPEGMNVPTDEIGRLQLQAALGIGMTDNAQGRKASDQKPPAMGENAAGPTITTS